MNGLRLGEITSGIGLAFSMGEKKGKRRIHTCSRIGLVLKVVDLIISTCNIAEVCIFKWFVYSEQDSSQQLRSMWEGTHGEQNSSPWRKSKDTSSEVCEDVFTGKLGFRLDFNLSWRKQGRNPAAQFGPTQSSQGRLTRLYLLSDVFQILSRLHSSSCVTEDPHVLPAPTKLTARIW